MARRILARLTKGWRMYRLFGVPDFANLAVHVALEEAGVPYEVVFLDSEAGELQSPVHLARHPLGLVPALETPEGMMFETGACLLYLGERHGLARRRVLRSGRRS